MDKDPETLEEALVMMKQWKRLYAETLDKVATARAEALRDAADRAEVHVMTNTVGCLDLQGLRQAIIADKQWEPQ